MGGLMKLIPLQFNNQQFFSLSDLD